MSVAEKNSAVVSADQFTQTSVIINITVMQYQDSTCAPLAKQTSGCSEFIMLFSTCSGYNECIDTIE